MFRAVILSDSSQAKEGKGIAGIVIYGTEIPKHKKCLRDGEYSQSNTF